MDINLLRNYKVQNPVKYAQKFGDKTPEELATPVPTAPLTSNRNGVTVSFGEKKEKEMELKEFVVDPMYGVVGEATTEEKPKKKIKK